MIEWIEPNEEHERFVHAPDSETEPDPYFAGMSWQQIIGEMARLEDEAWYQQMLEEEYYRLYEGGD